MKNHTPHNPGKLRNQAEEQVRKMEPVSGSSQTNMESQRALHELHVHQIELEMQNEELRTAQTEIEAGRARYLDLYDLAPVGYCTLSEQGLILEANLTAATLLGMTRDALIKQLISNFIFKDDQDVFYLHRQQLFQSPAPEFREAKHGTGQAGKPQECELRLVKPDGTRFWAHLMSTAAQAEDGAPLCRVVLSDITDRKHAEEKISELAAKFQGIFEQSSAGSVIVGMDKRFIRCNPAFCKFLGYKENELIGKTISEVTFPEDIELGMKEMKQIAEGKLKSFAIQKRYLRKDGQIVWGDLNISLIRDADNNPLYFLPVIIDITERKQIEEEAVALKESLDSVAGFVFAKNLDLKYVSANRSFCDLLKIPYDKIQGMTDYDIFPSDLAAKYIADDKRVIETAKELTVEEETINATTKQRFIVQTRKFPRFDKSGRVTGLYGVGYDVTELKQAEYALRDREYLLNESQKAGNIGSYALDFATNNWQSSEMLDLLLGINRDYPKSIESWLELVYPDDRQMMDQYLKEEVIAKRKLFNREYRITRRSDETVRWMHGLGRLSFDKDNNLLCMIGTIQDITERKLAEAERDNLQSQLAQAQKMESVGRLAGGVAHDFNNMLGVILGQTELAIESLEPDAPLHGDLKEIQKAARRSADLTHQLLAFARKQTVAPKVLDLNERLSDMLKMLKRLIGEDIEIAWKPGHGLWPVKIDPAQVDQMFANLCVNARDAIADSGKIIIETGNTAFDDLYCARNANFIPGDFVLLSVSDNGCGMDAEMLERIFEPFFTTKETGKGTGLGLATVYGAVKQNQGFIQVDSEPGHGTTFNIYLPRYTGQAAETQEPKPQAAKRGSGETILLVEDRLEVLKTTTSMLQRLGYQVVAAGTPGEAIRLAQENAGHLDLLITDVVMPEIHGRDLAKKLQSLYPGLRVLFMSGYTADVIAHHGVLHEGLQFIQKPFSIMELGAKLREVFAGRHAGQDKKQL